MADTETNYPGTVAIYNGWHGWTAWGTEPPTQLGADDDSYVTCNLNQGQKSKAIRMHTFGFALAGSTGINAIYIEKGRKTVGSGSSGNVDNYVHFCTDASSNSQANATTNATNLAKAGSWTTSEVMDSHQLTDALYSEAQIKDSNFGGIFDLYHTSGSTETFMVDYFRIKVDFATGGTSIPVMSHHYTKNIGSR